MFKELAKRVWLWCGRHRALCVVFAVIGVLAVAAAVSFFIPLMREICDKNEYTGAKECASYHVAAYLFLGFINVTNEYGAAITALATIAVAGFTFTLWHITGRAVDLTREEFSANLRPWLSVKPKLASDLVFEDRRGAVTIDFKIRNTGNSPAFNIMIQCHFITVEDRAQLLLDNFMKGQTQYYSGLKRPDPMIVGHSLFPQEKMKITRGLIINRDEIERHTGGKEGAGFSLILVGSISYRSPIDRDIHHTGFIYNLRRPKPEEPSLSLNFGSHDHRRRASEIELNRAFQSGFAD